MPVDFQRIVGVTRTIPVAYFGETVHVTYRPAALRGVAEWQAEHGDEPGSLLEAVARTIERWDIAADGEPLPVTVAVMSGEHPGMTEPLPPKLLRVIQEAVWQDFNEGGVGVGNAIGSPSDAGI